MNPHDTTDSILRSCRVAAWCTVLALPIVIACGYLLARKQFLGKSLVSALLLLPLVMPPVVTGILLLDLVGRRSWIGRTLEAYGTQFVFDEKGAILAALVVGLPLGIQSARSAFESVDPRLEALSSTLGDSRWRTFTRVTLPLALRGILAGCVLMFARALGEFGATVVVVGNTEGKTRTIALAVYALLEDPHGESQLRPLLIASMLLSLASVLAYETLLRRPVASHVATR